MTVRAVAIFDGESQGTVAFDQRFGEGVCIVGRIVEHLNLQQAFGVFDLGDFVDEPLDHVTLVIQRELDRDGRQLLEPQRRLVDGLLAVLEVRADGVVAMQPVD